MVPNTTKVPIRVVESDNDAHSCLKCLVHATHKKYPNHYALDEYHEKI